MQVVELTGSGLDLLTARQIIDRQASVKVAAAALEAMDRGRKIVDKYIDEGIPAYGLNTGLGARAGQALSREEIRSFSMHMVKGRAQGVGPPADAATVRAVMLARLNSMLTGAAGASCPVAMFIAEALNRDLIAVMPRTASIGAGDLVAMAAMANAFIGHGEMMKEGKPAPASDVLHSKGIAPLQLGPKDGLMLCNNTAVSTGHALTAVLGAQCVLDGLQIAAALSLEGFRANVSPFTQSATTLRPQRGQAEAALQIRHLLEGGKNWRKPAGRRLQDPLSFRCITQVNGAALAQLAHLSEAIETELNGVSDNPAVLIDEGRIVSTGNFHTPYLSQCLDNAARALAWAATDSVSRVQRMMNAQLSGLPPLLSSSDVARAGFGPLLKPLEALRASIVHMSTPVPVMASFNADGVEDSATFCVLSAQKLLGLVKEMELLVSFELTAAIQAIDLAGDVQLSPHLDAVVAAVRGICPMLDDDRPIGRELEAVASDLIANNRLAVVAGLSTMRI